MKCLLWIPVILAYFPFVGGYPGTDLQPFFFISAIAISVLFLNYFKFAVEVVIAFLVSIFFIILWAVLYLDSIDMNFLAVYLVAIFTMFFFYGFYGAVDVGLTKGCILLVATVYAVVGAVQLVIPDFMASLVQRSVEAALSFDATGRGVRSLTSEPSALGKVFTSLNVLYVFVSVWRRPKTGEGELLGVSLLFFLVSALLARSAYALSMHLFLILILWSLLSFRTFVVAGVIAVASAMLFGTLLFLFAQQVEGVRALSLLVAISSDPDFVLSQGAMRKVFNIPITIDSLRFFGLAGSGNSGESYFSSVWTPWGALDYEVRARALGGFVEFLLRFGMFGLPIFILYAYFLFNVFRVKCFVNSKRVRVGIYFGVAVVVLSMQDSSPALPMSLLILMVVNRKLGVDGVLVNPSGRVAV